MDCSSRLDENKFQKQCGKVEEHLIFRSTTLYSGWQFESYFYKVNVKMSG